jgi:hypothetical protein
MALAIGVCLSLTLTAPPAEAHYLSKRERTAGLVTACSWQNSDRCYTARIVPHRLGPKLQLKSGMLIDCAGDCRDTLRRETVDFWDDQRERSRD